jgi:hypothetical protein
MGIAEQVNDDRENQWHSPSDYTLGKAKVRGGTYIAGITITDFDNTAAWNFVVGSKEVTCTSNINYGASTPTVVGDFIAVIDTGAVGTVSDANADYFRVESINGLVLTLDRPYVHGSFEAGAGGSDLVVVPKATAEALADSVWSIDIPNGAHATPAVGAFSPIAGVFNNNLITAHIGLLGGFDCNGTVSSTANTTPSGQDWQVSQLELKFGKNAIGSGNRPSPYRTPFPLSQLRTNESLTASGSEYYVLSITYADGHESAGTVVKSPYVVRLCIADGAATTYTDVVNTAMAAGWNGIAGSINADGVILQM